MSSARSRSGSVSSNDYYTTDNGVKDETISTLAPPPLAMRIPIPSSHPIGGHNLRQSAQLPAWLSATVGAVLGVPLGAGPQSLKRAPVIATLLYTSTFASALGFFLTTLFFEGYNIASVYTKQDILEGSITVVLTGLWCAFGIYANGLARRLFAHPKFASMLRLHAKTVLKLNAALVVGALFLGFVCTNNVNSVDIWQDDTCHTVGTSAVVCKLRYICKVIYSCFAFLWNLLVAVVLISVCRTHTIGLRRFLWELERDAASFMSQGTASSDLADECAWIDEDDWEEIYPQRRPHSYHFDSPPPSDPLPNPIQPRPQSMDPAAIQVRRRETELNDFTSERDDFPIWRPDENRPASADSCREQDAGDSILPTTQPLATQEILLKYWKISCRLRLSSLALQRWTVSMFALTVVWSAVQLVRWLSHAPILLDVLEFLLPLLLLPLLASAYAEVNVEGRRMVLHILPLESRIPLLRYLQVSPLQMTVFGFPISYATIATAAVGILLAMLSKILLQELSSL